jgi:hypothetical protein
MIIQDSIIVTIKKPIYTFYGSSIIIQTNMVMCSSETKGSLMDTGIFPFKYASSWRREFAYTTIGDQ